ncbi:MAG: glycosidase [Bacteroidetes bacterium]|nr:glycosidase [Bacteroidota bacterium]
MLNKIIEDYLILEPADIDLQRSPLRVGIKEETFVLGTFNPGMERLPNGNIVLMVRVAEAITNNPESKEHSYIRWDSKSGFVLEKLSYDDLDRSDPRKFIYKHNLNKTYCLTSFSWLLPVELNSSASEIVEIHYNKAIIPTNEYQEYGIEDARITKIDETYYMTACAVSSLRHSTVLYKSGNGLDYEYLGVILDHQNKDMVLFAEKVDDFYYALTRPIGDHYFYSKTNFVGPTIQMSKSPDLIHWAPVEEFKMRIYKKFGDIMKVGGGAPPIKYKDSWLVLFHTANQKSNVGMYNTSYMLLDFANPSIIKEVDLLTPFLSSNPELTNHLDEIKYMDDVVFTTGAIIDKESIVIASGELDLCCRITKMMI